ncbi:MAG: hypothetical protein QME35_02965 [Thermoanaerobacteraceae bacterium]|nr:hypothetical protein [Thermoanaerobacteraceae bacterium]
MLERIKKAYFVVSAAFLTALPNIVLADSVQEVNSTGINNAIFAVVKIISDIGLAVAAVFIGINGFKIASSSTNPQRRSEGMSGLVWAIFGGLVAISLRWFAGIALGIQHAGGMQ